MDNSKDQEIADLVNTNVRSIIDYPKPGINFRDICPLVKNPDAMAKLIQFLAFKINEQIKNVDYIAGLEARGFIFGPLIAAQLNKGFIPIRKKGKLPGEKILVEYKLEYGSDVIEMQADSLHKGARVVIVDDLIATGGTAMGAAQLIEKGEGVVAGYVFVIELKGLKGKERLPQNIPIITAFAE